MRKGIRRTGLAVALGALLWLLFDARPPEPPPTPSPLLVEERVNARELARIAQVLEAVKQADEVGALEGTTSGEVALEDLFPEDEDAIEVVVQVVDERGASFLSDHVFLWSTCGVASAAYGGKLTVRTPVGATCFAMATRKDGMLTGRAEPVEFVAEYDGQEVELPFYARRTGGLGVQIRQIDGGIAVGRVFAGTPAEEMGLVEGDVILEVEGRATSEMELEEFIAYMTGPEGSEVQFVLESEGDTGLVEESITIERRYLGG